jgi:hypothetical protein
MTAAVEVATRMPAVLPGIAFRLGVLVLSPFVLWIVFVVFAWVEDMLDRRRPVRHAETGGDVSPPAPEPLDALGVDLHAPNVVSLAGWRRGRVTS